MNGFDPKGAAYVHGMYQQQAPLQGRVTGTTYSVGPRGKCPDGNSQWTIHSQNGAQQTQTTFEYVRWDDIVRAHWPRTSWQVLVGSIQGYMAALASLDSLQRVYRASPRTLVALAYPAAFWLAALLIGLLLGAIAHRVTAGASTAAAWTLAAAAFVAVLWGFLEWERKLNTSWLLRIYQFAGDWKRGRTPAVPARAQEAAEAILEQLQNPEVDEVLLVGFSVGSLLAVSTAVRVQRLAEAASVPLDRFSMMTLGHCIPLLGLMAGAEGFRAELASLGKPPHVQWVDFSSPTDWGSFPLVDPIAICVGAPTPERPFSPRMLSPRFHTMFDPAVYATLVGDKRRIHLQYIMAGERPALYDYFAITAGPQRLADRVNSPAGTENPAPSVHGATRVVQQEGF